MNEKPRATIMLTSTQVAQVIRQAGRASWVLEKIEDPYPLREVMVPPVKDVTLSRSTLRALLILDSCDHHGEPRGITEVASELGLSPSTAHRYARTWIALGLLDQDVGTGRYRRADVRSRASSSVINPEWLVL
jgi:hypothetical protein